jgi:hypothetical protein
MWHAVLHNKQTRYARKIIGPFMSSEKIESFCQLFISPNQPSTKQMSQRQFLRSIHYCPDINRVVVLVHHQFSELALETKKRTLDPQIPCSTFDCLTNSCDQSIAAAGSCKSSLSSLCRMLLFLSPVSTARDTRNWKLWRNHLASFSEQFFSPISTLLIPCA